MPEVYVVQFPHPGGEHRPTGEFMPWNQGNHRRKFLVSDGVAQDADGQPRSGRYVFWGEWEAQSRVVRRWPAQGELPRCLHIPYWSTPPEANRQNTDPWVFGERFRYSNCKQLTARPHCNPSAMQDLTRGSIVLFGSQVHGEFVLDTLLVVADATRYIPIDTGHLGVDEAFSTCTLKSLTTGTEGFGYRDFTLFSGATPDDPVSGMFSFTPCRPAGDGCRFARPSVRLPGLINPASKQSPSGSHRPLTTERARQTWKEIRHQVLARDLLIGTHFDTPPKGETGQGTAGSRRPRG